jgi:hypothetical protein
VFGVSLLGGCAIHYSDPETGAEHIIGFGHMVMRVPKSEEGLKAVIKGTDVLGVGVGSIDGQPQVIVGWSHQRQARVLSEDASIRLEWPQGNFLNLRVGSVPPKHVMEGLR